MGSFLETYKLIQRFLIAATVPYKRAVKLDKSGTEKHYIFFEMITRRKFKTGNSLYTYPISDTFQFLSTY